MNHKTQILPRKAEIRDVPGIKSLIDRWSDGGLMLPKSLNEIYDDLRDFWVFEDAGVLSGCAGLHISWADLAEIRSLAVLPENHRRGVGSLLLGACVAEAGEIGIKRIFALTYAKEFFFKHGFREVDKSSLPHKIWSDCVKCPKFPDCDETAVLYEFDRRKPAL